jgi:hypothetical protein
MSYKPNSVEVTRQTKLGVHQPGANTAEDYFVRVIGWTTDASAAPNGSEMVGPTKNILVGLQGACIVMALNPELTLGAAIILAGMEIGLAAGLDSTILGEDFSINKGQDEWCWTMANWDQLKDFGPPPSSYKASSAYWSLNFARDYEAHAIVVDNYDDSGFVGRAGTPGWITNATLTGNNPVYQGKHWYQYWYVRSGYPGPEVGN